MMTGPKLDSLLSADAALSVEIAQEKASALGRLGRELENRLAQLARFDAEQEGALKDASGQAPQHLASDDAQGPAAQRHALVSRAGVALWNFIVQREAVGLRDTAAVMRDYRVPRDVYVRMGAFPRR